MNKTMDPHVLARIYYYRGRILMQGLREPGRALYNYERTLELDPAYPQADQIRNTVMILRSRGLQPLADEPAAPTPASR